MWQPFDKIDNETKSQMPFEYGIRPVAALKSNIQIDYSLLNFFHFFLASVDLVFFFLRSNENHGFAICTIEFLNLAMAATIIDIANCIGYLFVCLCARVHLLSCCQTKYKLNLFVAISLKRTDVLWSNPLNQRDLCMSQTISKA